MTWVNSLTTNDGVSKIEYVKSQGYSFGLGTPKSRMTAALDWSGLAVFRDTPIDDALARLAARSGTPVRADARLAGQRVTGTFDASRPLEEVLGALAVPLGATVERDADGYTLR